MRLAVSAPFRLDLTVWALRRATSNRIDTWDGRQWRRSVFLGDAVVGIAVEQCGPIDAPVLTLRCVDGDRCGPNPVQAIAAVVRRVLGLDANDLDRLIPPDPQITALARRYRGLRPPRFVELFEALANAIACQQVSLASGLALLSKTAASLAPARLPADFPPPFPRPETILAAGGDALRRLGWSRRKSDYLLGCAQAVVGGALDPDRLEAAGDAEVMQLLSRLRGIKRWSAQYVALRGLGRLAVLPVDDVGAHKHLALWLGRPRLDAAAMELLAERWAPAAGLVYFLLLLKRLDDAGLIDSRLLPQHGTHSGQIAC
ncbi:MAG: DNA-3-methyladenine glycosylase 2 [Thiomonas sp.]